MFQRPRGRPLSGADEIHVVEAENLVIRGVDADTLVRLLGGSPPAAGAGRPIAISVTNNGRADAMTSAVATAPARPAAGAAWIISAVIVLMVALALWHITAAARVGTMPSWGLLALFAWAGQLARGIVKRLSSFGTRT